MVFADNKLLILIIGGFLVAALAACSIPGHHYATVERLNAEGDFAGACRYVEEHAKDYGMGNRLLYELDRGTLAFAAGDYPDAIEAFTEAERLMENLYTISLINEATTWVINDNMAPYRGEDFESVMVNLFLALSYANLGQVENALVEVRKIDSKLAAINLQYDEAHKNAYQEDPFARLLMGILYEMGRTSGDLNDAYISYYLAMKGYESEYSRYGTAFPRVLAENALSLAEFMGEKQLQLMRRSLPHLSHPSLAERRELAEVYCFHFNGRAPVKMEEQIFLPLPDGYIAKVAFPRYQRILEQIAARLHAHSLEDDREYQSEFALAEPIDSIAIENLKNRQGRIMLKATVRATAKYFAVKVGEAMMQTDEGIVPGLIIAGFGNLMALTSEQADLRSWRTLPAEILISKLTIPPGSYRFWAECADNSGSPTKRLDLGKRQLQAGDKVFLQFTTRQGSFPPLEEERGQLFVSTNPPDAMVRVLNIGPRFHQQGMRLEPGKYNLEISAPGYETEITWTELSSGEDKKITVDLREVDGYR
jgi:hypothetical protein